MALVVFQSRGRQANCQAQGRGLERQWPSYAEVLHLPLGAAISRRKSIYRKATAPQFKAVQDRQTLMELRIGEVEVKSWIKIRKHALIYILTGELVDL